jgi:uncharacterized protein YhbP (UPF0306 family)
VIYSYPDVAHLVDGYADFTLKCPVVIIVSADIRLFCLEFTYPKWMFENSAGIFVQTVGRNLSHAGLNTTPLHIKVQVRCYTSIMNTLSRIKEVLDSTYLMSLGIVDEKGPWVADVIFIYDDAFNIYWMSMPQTRHSRAVIKNPKVAATITAAGGVDVEGLGVQIEGTAEKIEGNRHDLALIYAKKKHEEEPDPDENYLEGHSWYMLKPSVILLIDQANFGFKRQVWQPE